LRAQIGREVSTEKKRPVTDEVGATCSPGVGYQISARLTLVTTADQEMTLAAAREAINTWARSRQTRLGQDSVPNQIIKVLQVDGVYDGSLDMPSKKVYRAHVLAECTAIDGTTAGVSEG
uniref:baseplate J/gp47 family protein n=1 Tax=Salmonella enterica TaxID=28901 RepID=UPI00398C829A